MDPRDQFTLMLTSVIFAVVIGTLGFCVTVLKFWLDYASRRSGHRHELYKEQVRTSQRIVEHVFKCYDGVPANTSKPSMDLFARWVDEWFPILSCAHSVLPEPILKSLNAVLRCALDDKGALREEKQADIESLRKATTDLINGLRELIGVEALSAETVRMLGGRMIR